jgi:hypothetical protein
VRALAVGGLRQDGEQIAITDWSTGAFTPLGGHLRVQAYSLTLGFTPNGHYGLAVENAPLLDGWEVLFKAEAGRVKAVDKGPAWYRGIHAGVNWQVTPQVRLQGDAAYEWFNENAEGVEASPAGSFHVVTNVWMVCRL